MCFGPCSTEERQKDLLLLKEAEAETQAASKAPPRALIPKAMDADDEDDAESSSSSDDDDEVRGGLVCCSVHLQDCLLFKLSCCCNRLLFEADLAQMVQM